MRGARFRFASAWLAMLLAVSLISLTAPRCPSAEPQGLPSAAAVVKPQAYVSLDPVPRGREFEVAITVEIARGFHMNSHKPSDDYLIPTTITPQLPPGIKLADTIYPPGQLKKFAFSPNKPLDVYTGSVTLKLKLVAQANAALGAMTIPVTLRYQACNDAACLPPVKVPVNVALEVAAAGAKARAVHAEVFSAASPAAVPVNLLK
jgi:DsbC/DsbD-like thiol-disulfide interchange protein